MKVKLSKPNIENLKTWVIIILFLFLVTALAYYYIYPNIMKNAFKDAVIFLTNYMARQLGETGKIKINMDGTLLVLIPEENCYADKNG